MADKYTIEEALEKTMVDYNEVLTKLALGEEPPKDKPVPEKKDDSKKDPS